MMVETQYIRFQPSGIHGLGGFAKTAILKGTRVIEYLGERINKEESRRRCEAGNHYIFCLDEATDLDGSMDWNPARLLNHSCAPNCEAEVIDGQIWIAALRNLAPGEELTFNYGYDLDNYHDHPCRCGTDACVGFIVAEEFFTLVRQENLTF